MVLARDGLAALCQLLFMAILSPDQIRKSLKEIPEWHRRGIVILRTFELADFAAAMKFVTRAGRLAENAWHHPDIDIRWNKVTLSLCTHSEGGLTEKDFSLAAKLDRAVVKFRAV